MKNFTKSICLFFCAVLITTTPLAASAPADTVKLPKYTIVTLELYQPINSAKARTGDRVKLSVVKDVVVGGAVLIQTGAVAEGVLRRVQRRGVFGRPGLIELDITHLFAVDNQRVVLEAEHRVFEGDGRTTISVAGASAITIGSLALGFPVLLPLAAFGILIRGKDVELPVKAVFHASIAKPVRVKT